MNRLHSDSRIARCVVIFAAAIVSFLAATEAAEVNKSSVPAAEPQLPHGIGESRLKFVTTAEGVYRVDYTALSPHLRKLGDPRRWSLWCVGKPVPMLVAGEQDGRFDREDYIEWFAPTLRTPFNRIMHGSFDNVASVRMQDAYTTQGVYFLRFGGAGASPPLRLRDVPTTVHLPLRFWPHRIFRRTKRFEYDLIRRHFGPDRGAEYSDGKFWDHFSWSSRTFRHYYESLVGLAADSDQPCSLTVKLYGLNRPRNPPEHHARISIGKRGQRTTVGHARWPGIREFYVTTTTLSPRIFDEWVTEFVVEAVPRDSPDLPDMMALDWIEVSYPSVYRAEGDWLEFTGPPVPTDLPPPYGGWLNPLSLQTFTNEPIWALDLTAGERQQLPIQRRWKTAEGKVARKFVNVYLPLAKTGHRYVAYSPASVRTPATVRWVEPDRLRTKQQHAQYLIITHEKFRNEAQRLADHRTKLGLKSFVVTTDEIADSFHEGFVNIVAIKEFIRLAYLSWDPKPRFVLLVGDASWDDLGIQGSEFANYLPAFYYGTPARGYYASDNWFACVANADQYPDLAIGRLPVRSVEEARAYVDKVIEYDTRPAKGDWRNSALLISSYNTYSHRHLDQMADTHLTGFSVTKRYTGRQMQTSDAYATTVTRSFDQGHSLVVFAGHGGSFVWQVGPNPGGRQALDLFSPKHVKQLSNKGKYPLVLALTCYTNSFDNPLQQTIGESLILEPGRGAIGVISAAWRGMLGQEFPLANAIIEMLRKDPDLAIGEALAAAKRSVQIDPDTHGVCLLGDPALRVQLGARTNRRASR